MSKICVKSLEILQISSKILPKPTKNDPKSRKIRPWTGFGAKSRPGRLQDASGVKKFGFREPFWLKMSLQGSVLGSQEKRKSVQNRIFEYRRALGPSKNGHWKEVRKKHESLMKNRCINQGFLMAWNHVWRYTLRLFHTFAIFERSRKIDAKRVVKREVFDQKSTL